MTKIYILTQPKNSATFTLLANNGKMSIRYTFRDGNVLMNIKARCTLHNKFYQSVLENCELFKAGVIKIERVIKDEEPEVEEKVESGLQPVKGITTVGEAVDWVATTLGISVKTAKQAKNAAAKNGYDLVDLKTKEN